MTLGATVALIVVGAGLAFAGLVQLWTMLIGRHLGSPLLVSALVWAPLTAAAAYLLFLWMDWEAALTHRQNVGILVIAFGFWVLTAVPGVLVGIAITLLCRHFLRARD